MNPESQTISLCYIMSLFSVIMSVTEELKTKIQKHHKNVSFNTSENKYGIYIFFCQIWKEVSSSYEKCMRSALWTSSGYFKADFLLDFLVRVHMLVALWVSFTLFFSVVLDMQFKPDICMSKLLFQGSEVLNSLFFLPCIMLCIIES